MFRRLLAASFVSVSSLRAVLLVVVALFGCVGSAVAQSAALIGGNQVQAMAQERKDMAATERQKKMVGDADKLVTLAQELKVSVDKTTKDTLSVDVIKEAERIEKLARELRESMRQ